MPNVFCCGLVNLNSFANIQIVKKILKKDQISFGSSKDLLDKLAVKKYLKNVDRLLTLLRHLMQQKNLGLSIDNTTLPEG